jgi:hypothetical protein
VESKLLLDVASKNADTVADLNMIVLILENSCDMVSNAFKKRLLCVLSW